MQQITLLLTTSLFLQSNRTKSINFKKWFRMQEGRRVSASLPIDAAKESNPVTSSYETAVLARAHSISILL